MEELILYIRNHVKEIRQLKGITQEELSAMSGVSYKHIQKIEGSNPSIPNIFTLYKISNALGFSLSKFFANFRERERERER